MRSHSSGARQRMQAQPKHRGAVDWPSRHPGARTAQHSVRERPNPPPGSAERGHLARTSQTERQRRTMEARQPRNPLPALPLASASLSLGRGGLPGCGCAHAGAEMAAGPTRQPTVCSSAAGRPSGSGGSKRSARGSSGSSSSSGGGGNDGARFNFTSRALRFGAGAGGGMAAYVSGWWVQCPAAGHLPPAACRLHHDPCSARMLEMRLQGLAVGMTPTSAAAAPVAVWRRRCGARAPAVAAAPGGQRAAAQARRQDAGADLDVGHGRRAPRQRRGAQGR